MNTHRLPTNLHSGILANFDINLLIFLKALFSQTSELDGCCIRFEETVKFEDKIKLQREGR